MRTQFPTFFTIAALLLFMLGCAPPPPSGDPSNGGSQEIPDLTTELINERINDARVYDVPPESGNGEPVSWSFDFDEPKEITVVDKQIDGTHATVVLDIKTKSALRARIHRELAGRIRTDWELQTSLVFRRWEIVNTENISMKYKDFPKADGNSNTNANTQPPGPPDLPGRPRR